MSQPPANNPSAPYLFSVMDGHGGDEAAKEMHHLLPQFVDVKSLAPVCYWNRHSSQVIFRFIAADKTLRDKLPEGNTAGTTCTSALISKHETDPDNWDVTLANAGDSRSIVIHADGSFTATEDHKPDLEKETERIERAGGCVSTANIGPARVDYNLAVSRAFGDFAYKSISLNAHDQKVSCVPEVLHVIAKTGDLVFLACDGIFDVMSNEEVVEFISKYDDRSDLGNILTTLLRLVLEKGSKDNCSAMIVDLTGLEEDTDTGKKRKREEEESPFSTSFLDSSLWDGWHTGYWTRQLIDGNHTDDDQVRDQFELFHTTYGFPSNPLHEACSHCERIFLGMRKCSRCGQELYCSTYCKDAHWEAKHKETCVEVEGNEGNDEDNEDNEMNKSPMGKLGRETEEDF